MAETRFIRTVVFGGYDKGDVDKKLDYIYNLFFDNKNKLRETKLLLDKIRGGADEKDALDSVLAGESFRASQDDAVYYDKRNEEPEGLVHFRCVGLHRKLEDGNESRDDHDIHRNVDLVRNDGRDDRDHDI